MKMERDYDYIIIGSGFGGSVSALRLSEKGYRVLVIEKGKWYHQDDFAKTNWNLAKWLWIPYLRLFGIMKISIFRHAAILSGTGVGGGSLVYANTLPLPKSAFYNSGSWSSLADWESELKPYYTKALTMLGASKNPKFFDGDIALRKLAKEMDREKHFEAPQVAVFFGAEGEEVNDPYFEGKGPARSGCTFCGGCMTGCRHNAKNTLDKNYLYFAQKQGAEILAENEVVNMVPLDGADGSTGYKVMVKSSVRLFAESKTYTAKGVVFAGGVLGTVKLLLKLKKKSLPLISNKLGDDIRTNNETLISVTTLDTTLDMSKGVAIGSILQTDDNSHLEVVRYSEGSGFWKMFHLPLSDGSDTFTRLIKMVGVFFRSPLGYLKVYWVNSWSKHTVVLLFMQHLDSKLRFKRNGLGSMVSSVSSGKKPSPNIPESVELTKKYASIVNGKATSFALETFAGIPSTAHILGGAVMGKDKSTGVIDKDNRVFGYQNMWVVDGSMISANPGVNPSLSITAIAERAMDQIPTKK
jgi:cholesterol oxidase